MKIKSLRYNININYIFYLFMNLNFTSGLWMIYLANQGMSLLQLGLLEGIFHVTGLVMEVPTGAVADILGRKYSRLIGRFTQIVSLVLLLMAHSFWGYAISFVLSALSYNLESGAGEAFLYDTLKYHNKEKDYIRIYGKLEGIYQVASIVALSVAGYLALIDYKIPFLSTMLASLFALFICMLLVEPIRQEKTGTKKMRWKQAVFHQYQSGWQALKGNRELQYLMVFSTLLPAVSTVIFFFIQNYWKSGGIPESIIGLVLAASSACAAVGGLSAHKLERKVNKRNFVKYAPLIFAVPFLLIPLGRIGYVALMGISLIESMFFVLNSSYINQLIDSDIRATMLSVQSAFFSLFMILIFPLFGWLSQLWGMRPVLFGIGVFVVLLAVGNRMIFIKDR